MSANTIKNKNLRADDKCPSPQGIAFLKVNREEEPSTQLALPQPALNVKSVVVNEVLFSDLMSDVTV